MSKIFLAYVIVPIAVLAALFGLTNVGLEVHSSVMPASEDIPATESAWPMVAANAQRTSWTPEEVRGHLDVEWYRPIEPYVHLQDSADCGKWQIFVSTARGLYAFDAERW